MMKRSPIKPSKILPRPGVTDSPRKPMRRRAHRSTAATRSARDQDCTLQLPGCTNQKDTVVLDHVRRFGGGGMGLKPHDIEAVYGCLHCHDLLDGRTHLPMEIEVEINWWEYIAWALIRTHRVMVAASVLLFKDEAREVER